MKRLKTQIVKRNRTFWINVVLKANLCALNFLSNSQNTWYDGFFKSVFKLPLLYVALFCNYQPFIIWKWYKMNCGTYTSVKCLIFEFLNLLKISMYTIYLLKIWKISPLKEVLWPEIIDDHSSWRHIFTKFAFIVFIRNNILKMLKMLLKKCKIK